MKEHEINWSVEHQCRNDTDRLPGKNNDISNSDMVYERFPTCTFIILINKFNQSPYDKNRTLSEVLRKRR